MKQKKIWITLAASALIITGCSSGHENDKSKIIKQNKRLTKEIKSLILKMV